MSIQVSLKAGLAENVRYDHADYPVYIRRAFLSSYPNYTALSHWHDDIELIAVLEGEMSYNINGEIITLQPGEGIWVNSRQLHFGFSETHRECDFICILIHPMLLCITPETENRFVLPVLQNRSLPFIHLRPGESWQKEILEKTTGIWSAQDSPAFLLKIQSCFTWIWSLVYENMPSTPGVEKSQNNLSILKNMISFIQKHYMEPLQLQQIASSGGVGQSKCCRLFREYLHQTPNTCLTSYRLSRSTGLLLQTDMNITEIAYAVGFNGASYFTETFRRYFHCSPSVYRQMHQEENL